MAPYVYLESGDYYGVFSDNGFLMMPNKKYDASFTSWSEVNVQKFQSGLKIRYDVIHIIIVYNVNFFSPYLQIPV